MLIKLIEQIKLKSTPIKVISKYDTSSKQGFVFERLWDLVIKFGYCDLFSNTEYKHIDGNINTGKPKFLTSLKKYINETNIISGNSGGCSDITLYKPDEDKYIFISCKYFTKLNDIKNVIKYDIQNIIAVINSNKEIYQNYEIYLFVNNKKNILKRIKKANKSSYYIIKYMTESNILDMDDLTKYYRLLRNELKKYDIDEYDEIFGYGKTNLVMRFHQQIICNQIFRLVNEGQKQLLLGAKPRSGKTYICGGSIVMLKEDRIKFNVLIITPAPTETAPQFTEELFEKYKEFNDCNIIHIDSSKKIKHLKDLLGDKNIIVTSKQLLQQYIGDKRLKLPKINIILFDENHFAGTTDLSKEILNTYSSASTIKIYLTATYNKPLKEWGIPDECQMYWDIEDEQFCKARNIDKLIDKHGDEVKKVIKNMKIDGLSEDDIFGMYDNYPDLHLITNMFDPYRYEIIKDEIMDSKYGFSFDVLFSFGNKKKTNFRYSSSVEQILRYISGSYKETDYPDKDKSIFGRIESMCEKNRSRKPFTQLWFLPAINGINEISKCLKELMMKNKVLSKYDVMIINSKVDDKVKDIKAEITKNEKVAKENGKLGLILLAGNMLSLGITLKLCDIVMLLNNTLSADRVMQMMYRCMSESMNGDKKFGFVVDLNISRVIHSCISYNIYKKDMNIEDKIDYLVKGHLINIDADLFDNKEIDSTKIVTKLLDIWKSDPINNLKTMLKQIENDIIELKSEDQKLLDAYFTKAEGKTVDIEMILKDDEDETQSIKSGISDSEDDKKVYKDNGDKLEKKISFTKDVLPFIIPLSCILTMSDKNKDFVEMLNTIKEDKELLEVFNDQSMIWWNQIDIINLVKELVTKYIDKNSIAYNVSVNFKLSLQSLIDNPKELLELIDSCLKPKQEEKKKYGEVGTPFKLINEMLNKLPKKVWKNKNYKWFDPANGMGNFPIAIYLRLMKGLKEKIPNDKERKKHILENMLYMSELNKKNVYVCKQIFDINDEYKLNLYNGDSLELDTRKEWGIDKFDVLVGNPPYNKGGIKSHTGKYLGEKNETIWPKFVEYSINHLNDNGFLVFINPLSWLKKSHNLHDKLLDKYVVWMKLWDNSQSKTEINADIPLSLYIIHNIKNDSKISSVNSILKRRHLETVSTVFLDKKYSIPLAYHSIFDKLKIKIEEDPKLKLKFYTKTVKSEKEQIKLPKEHDKTNLFGIDTYRINDGYYVKKMINTHPHQAKKKLILANKASLTGGIIDAGKLGLVGNHKFYIMGKKLELLNEFLNSKICMLIVHFTKYGQDFVDNSAFDFIPDVRHICDDIYNKETIYKYFKFTKEEISTIECKT